MQAGHRGQLALRHPQDLPQVVLLRVTVQPVAAADAVAAVQQAGVFQGGHQLLHIFQGDALPGGYVLDGGIAHAPMLGQIQQDPNGITSFGGNHGVCLLIYSAYYTTKLVGKASAVTVVLRKISGQLFRKKPTGERSGSPVGVDDREIIWCGNRGCPACGGRSDWRRCSRPVCAAPRQRAGSCGRRPPPAPAPPG